MRVEIESVAFGGSGIARGEGKVYFVKGGLPGDVLEIRVIRDKGSFAEAIIDEIISPSEDRIEAPCPVYKLCGGCQLQTLDYSAQVREKENIVSDTLKRIGGFEEIEVEPIFRSPLTYGYRNRVTLAAWYFSGGWHIGYNQDRTSRKVAIETCPVSDEHINKAIKRISNALLTVGDPNLPLEKVHITSNGESAYITLVTRKRRRGDSLKSLLKHLRRYEETENISVIGGKESEFGFSLSGFNFIGSPLAFIQANYPVNEAMMETVLKWAEGALGTVLDLYSGIGNFSIPLARVSERVFAVEVNNNSLTYAVKNAKANSIGNIEFLNISSEQFINDMEFEENSVDLIVLDPPREGARGIIDGIAEISPKKVIYISCDPATLSRDLKTLVGHGYELLKVRPFDMFPQTYHVETIALLTKV